jgi:uncharacterized repeat protein (TIGR03803 family)
MNPKKPVHLLFVLCVLLAGRLLASSQAAAPLPASENILYQFAATSTDATQPDAAPMQASDGNFYGTAFGGGAYGSGALYQITPGGKYQIVYSFTGGNDGAGPYNTPVEASDGNLYGVTNYYGADGTIQTGGTIYQYNLKTATLTTVYSFVNGGVAGFGDLADDGNGTLYGTANRDDPSGNNLGGVWSFNYLTNTFKTLHTFTQSQGTGPLGGVVLASDGNLYGTAECDGPYTFGPPNCNGYGTAFVMATDGSNFQVIHNFSNGTQGPEDGYWPISTLVEGPDGNLYGFTFEGGNEGNGTGVVYQIVPSGASSTFKTVYELQSGDGNNPLHGHPFLGGDGNLYIAGSEGGLYFSGQVMQISTSGTKATVFDFDSATGNGDYPASSPFEGTDGNLYGATAFGGANGLGVFYQLLTTLQPAIALTPSGNSIKNGGSVTLGWTVSNAFSVNAKVCMANSTDGTWSGPLATTGSVVVTPSATNAIVNYAITCGGMETATAQIVVGTIPPQITTGALAGGVTRSSYSQTLSELGGVAPFAWSVSSGTLPNGLTLNSATGTIAGTPTTPGTSTFTVTITDSESKPLSASANLSITVVHAPLVTPTTVLTLMPPTLVFGSSTTLTATVSGVSGVSVPTGTVQFALNGTDMGAPVALVNGAASAPDAPTSTGTYGFSATYSGDSNYTAGNVATTTLTVTASATAALAADPDMISIRGPGATGSTTLTLLNFPAGSAVMFNCAGLPAGANCAFGTVSSASTVSLVISTSGSTAAMAPFRPSRSHTAYALMLPGIFVLAGLIGKRKRIAGLLMLILLLPLATVLTACSGGSSTPGTPTGASNVTVTASAGSQTATISLALVIQ